MVVLYEFDEVEYIEHLLIDKSDFELDDDEDDDLIVIENQVLNDDNDDDEIDDFVVVVVILFLLDVLLHLIEDEDDELEKIFVSVQVYLDELDVNELHMYVSLFEKKL